MDIVGQKTGESVSNPDTKRKTRINFAKVLVCFSEYVNKLLCLRRICSPKSALKLINRRSNALSRVDTYLAQSDRRESLLFAIENDATSCASPSASEHLRDASLEQIK